MIKELKDIIYNSLWLFDGAWLDERLYEEISDTLANRNDDKLHLFFDLDKLDEDSYDDYYDYPLYTDKDIDKAVKLLIEDGDCYKFTPPNQSEHLQQPSERLSSTMARCKKCDAENTFLLDLSYNEEVVFPHPYDAEEWMSTPRRCGKCDYKWIPDGTVLTEEFIKELAEYEYSKSPQFFDLWEPEEIEE
jgi:hypothetical protein